jgi:glucuronate isomerase
MPTFQDALRAELDSVPVIDPHCHLRPARPQADDLADIVLYHHVWIELVSAGMPPTDTSRAGLPHEVVEPGMGPLERVHAALPYLDHIRNSTCGGFLRTILQDLYGVPGGLLTRANLESVFAAVAARAADPTWLSEVLQAKCHIAKALTVNGYLQPASCDIIGKGCEGVPVNLVSGKQTPSEMLETVERQLDRELRGSADLSEAMLALGREYARRDIHFVGLWVLPHLSYQEPTREAVDRALARAREGSELSHEALSAFTCFGLRYFLEGLREGHVRTIQLIVGAEVLPPHRSITHWGPELPGAIARLAGEYEDFEWSCSSACDANIQDLAILAKHVPNISVAGYWWHTLYPYYIRKSIETRLDIVPANKIVAFFSDAYHAEWCYPKLKLVNQIFGEVLQDRVDRGLYTHDVALSLVRQVFYENPRRIYGVEV